RALAEAPRGPKTQRRCLRCSRKLKTQRFASNPPLDIDRCPAGHGYWFDPGEMQALIARFESGETGAVSRCFADMFGTALKAPTPPEID
ncbi:zf-TFIIB domain-containing protein, partial [bacterium]|nr:zf-TFIIB domain-containing protein [bacterium]